MEGSLMEEANKMEAPVWEPLLIGKDGGFSGADVGGHGLAVTGQAR